MGALDRRLATNEQVLSSAAPPVLQVVPRACPAPAAHRDVVEGGDDAHEQREGHGEQHQRDVVPAHNNLLITLDLQRVGCCNAPGKPLDTPHAKL